MSFVANEVKIKGVSGGITNLKLDFVGYKYKKNRDSFRNKEMNESLFSYMYEAKFEYATGQWS